ncbi:hypothetical protein FHQ25_11930 [Testudinibacter sp. TR-2022]|uniref:ribonuclease domain-containing protein n=2 Tax=Testudinibacter sp. TR-2022 TaxID=2585029 RepID=UPI0011185162|nr:ribonuclease domain-containing protein [Testudinibacter sp. TR-2022]TNH06860.1 hypothetical protein FHQ25_11930 [Testudinibacter sp. TR-2022]
MKGDVPSPSAVSFINSDGKAQNLFSASGDEYYAIGKYSNLAAKYNRENNQFLTNILVPKVKNNLVFEGVKDGGNTLSEAARAALDSPIETSKNVVKTVEHSLSDCLKNPVSCATGKWATFDSASGDLLRTHYNQADVNALYGKDMRAETALVPLMRGGTVVAEVLPVVKAGSVAVKSIDNMLSPLAKGVSANESLPVVGKTTDYPLTEFNHQAHNAAIYEALKLDLKTQQAANYLIDSLKNTGKLPENFITKKEAENLGWKAGKKPVPDGKIIGGEPYSNIEGLLPSAPERKWFEADINYNGTKGRGGERLIYSNDGFLYFTRDHYNTTEPMGRWK